MNARRCVSVAMTTIGASRRQAVGQKVHHGALQQLVALVELDDVGRLFVGDVDAITPRRRLHPSRSAIRSGQTDPEANKVRMANT